MASIPCTSFSAAKIHENMKKEKQQQKPQFMGENSFSKGNELPPTSKSFLEILTPHNYNSKLMNSIWGLYNRYAPDAFQKNSEGSLPRAELAAPQAKTWSLWTWGRLN
ncbi:uncharacterized protein [Centruroides vittatus]